jgi:hypothetical protein
MPSPAVTKHQLNIFPGLEKHRIICLQSETISKASEGHTQKKNMAKMRKFIPVSSWRLKQIEEIQKRPVALHR